jgi:UPF0042 nucleotide-binding protein
MTNNAVLLMSFGYLHPHPSELDGAQFTIDVRGEFRDPHHDPAFRELTGRDDAVRARVLAQPGAWEFAEAQAAAIATLVPAASTATPPRVIKAAFGCAGGRHRSVVLADTVALLLGQQGIASEIRHLHIARPVVNR